MAKKRSKADKIKAALRKQQRSTAADHLATTQQVTKLPFSKPAVLTPTVQASKASPAPVQLLAGGEKFIKQDLRKTLIVTSIVLLVLLIIVLIYT